MNTITVASAAALTIKPAIAAKPIIIDIKNKPAIVAMLAETNGRATKHAFTTLTEIAQVAARGDAKLDTLKLPHSLCTGAVWIETSSEEVANSYCSTRQGTEVKLVRRAVRRAGLWPRPNRSRCTPLVVAKAN